MSPATPINEIRLITINEVATMPRICTSVSCFERGHDQEAATHAEQPGDSTGHGAERGQGGAAFGGPGQASGLLVEHAVLLAPGGGAVITRPGLELLTLQHAPGHQHHQRTEQAHQHRLPSFGGRRTPPAAKTARPSKAISSAAR